MKKFTKRVEDFTCEKCGREVKGNGYTNHCPHCLWSKHVDINPGDRLETCQGLMEPIGIETKGDSYMISHRCVKCGHIKRNGISPSDDFDQVIALSKKITAL